MKIIHIPDIGQVQIVKHAQSKSLRIAISPTGQVKVTIPSWTPYQAGKVFALSKKDWIKEHLTPPTILEDGMAIGKFHHLYFKSSETNKTISTKQKGSQLIVTHPVDNVISDEEVQQAAVKVSIRALRAQAENLLPNRLKTLAAQHGFTFKSVQVRQLRARWGSCNSKQEITLNLFLMQLPWELIDYVLIHELTHTKALHHGPEFWQIFETALPGAKSIRKKLHKHKPSF